ncbi:MAG: 4Fe-4S binding protein, partial [Pseudomonadota bacterium]
ACPAGALLDDPDRPRLSFQEEACVQCGLCKAICPEDAISLAPRLNFGESARQAVEKKTEEAFGCVRCGKPFGARGSVATIVEKLAGKHAMFASGDAADRILMCEDCRVVVQFESKGAPMAMGDRPRTRTTDDDLRERDLARAQGLPDPGL